MKADKYQTYMKLAEAMAGLSPDAETKVGAILLSSDNRVIASSLNGFLRGAPDDALPKTRPEKYIFIQHAERNLLYNCSYHGIQTKDTTIVCTLSPCVDCVRAAFQSGVKIIIFKDLYHQSPNAEFYTKLPDVKIEVSEIAGFTQLKLRRFDEKD